MGTESLERKLAAILYADVAGYSRLTGVDEDGTHRTLRAYLDAITSYIRVHKGRVVHYAGDAVLAEFGTVSNALSCAVDVQRDLLARNQEFPDDRKVQFRIGVNLGEVIVDQDEIYGDGVNVAARLESLAEPGGICISESVRTAIGKKLPINYDFMGEQQVKNIDEPVRAYRVRLDDQTAPSPTTPTGVSAKPSLAVLPFANMSGDPGQEYFSDGITEDIITELSRFRTLFVMSRNSSFAFKGQAMDVKELARKLGVRYVVEGSVRKAADRVRITAQLIDATAGSSLWAERYDRVLTDIFAVQDEISQSIAAAIEPELGAFEGQRSRVKASATLDAWDCYHQGLWHLYKFTVEGLVQAEAHFERAIDLDPEFGPAYARLAYAHVQKFWYGPNESREASLNQALAAAKRAVALDNKDAVGHFSLGRAYMLQGQHELGIAELRTALDLNPGFPQAHFGLGLGLIYLDREGEALPFLENAIRLGPHDPHLWTFFHVQAAAYYKLGRLKDAEQSARTSVRLPNTTYRAFATLTSILGSANKLEEAVPIIQELLRRKPEYSCSYAADDFISGRPRYKSGQFVEQYVEGLRKAGLP